MCKTPYGAPLQCGTLRTIVIHILLEQVEKYSIASAHQPRTDWLFPLAILNCSKIKPAVSPFIKL